MAKVARIALAAGAIFLSLFSVGMFYNAWVAAGNTDCGSTTTTDAGVKVYFCVREPAWGITRPAIWIVLGIVTVSVSLALAVLAVRTPRRLRFASPS
jgi:hypothetical protein